MTQLTRIYRLVRRTIGCEILEQLPETSAILVPMGDTALIRGIAAAAKQIAPRVKIIGVQAEQRRRTTCRGRKAKWWERRRATRLRTGWRRERGGGECVRREEARG